MSLNLGIHPTVGHLIVCCMFNLTVNLASHLFPSNFMLLANIYGDREQINTFQRIYRLCTFSSTTGVFSTFNPVLVSTCSLFNLAFRIKAEKNTPTADMHV